jgi:hypothetical protein
LWHCQQDPFVYSLPGRRKPKKKIELFFSFSNFFKLKVIYPTKQD